MPSVNMDEADWQVLLNILATTKEWPWTVTNPLLMKIGEQLRAKPRDEKGRFPRHPKETTLDGKETAP